MKIIQAATKWNADAHRFADIGSIEAGKLADILVLNSDPLADILNTRDIHLVLKDGRVHERGYHPDYGGHIFANSLTDEDRSVVEGLDWAEALKATINARDRLPEGASARDMYISPTPAIERIFPRTIPRGSPETVVTLKGFNFVQRSQVLLGEEILP